MTLTFFKVFSPENLPQRCLCSSVTSVRSVRKVHYLPVYNTAILRLTLFLPFLATFYFTSRKGRRNRLAHTCQKIGIHNVLPSSVSPVMMANFHIIDSGVNAGHDVKIAVGHTVIIGGDQVAIGVI